MKLNVYAMLLTAAPLLRAFNLSEVVASNLTLAFFPDSEGDACKSRNISNAVILTTSSMPSSLTCFNVSDIFSHRNSSSGFQNSSMISNDHKDGRVDPTNGVAWRLENQQHYDDDASYSHIWFMQKSPVENVGAGKNGWWVFYIYSVPDCQKATENNQEEPWYLSSCQTDIDDGQCESTRGGISSFAIDMAMEFNSVRKHCESWTQFGAASTIRTGAGTLVFIVASATAMWLLA
ncbi:hypothetical protein NLG97_g8131 [Lecanicillium saksenae]|uniref:Uncharacterized protein n=1 Tax=Lecanicillium saksenae TaxID=468837 RepID=A0ACC1QJT1_9HYPO|nr:hypothetical protein NLG97_g8131 [Lecanicillium saksenae]